MATTRELVLSLYDSGMSPAEIARTLRVSTATVYYYLKGHRLYAGNPIANSILRRVDRECAVLTSLTKAAARALSRVDGVAVVELRRIKGSGWALRLPGNRKRLHLVYKKTPACTETAARVLAGLVTVDILTPGTKRSIRIQLRQRGVPPELIQILLENPTIGTNHKGVIEDTKKK